MVVVVEKTLVSAVAVSETQGCKAHSCKEHWKHIALAGAWEPYLQEGRQEVA